MSTVFRRVFRWVFRGGDQVPEPGLGALVLRAAALLRAGQPSVRLWETVAAERPESSALRQLARGHEAWGVDLPRGESPDESLRMLHTVWTVALHSGAPLAATLERFAAALRDLDGVARRREVLLAGPRSTIRLVASLPPLSLVLATLLGFDPWPAFRIPLGVIAVIFGGLLLVLGIAWAHAMARRVADTDWVAGWAMELCSVALAGGGAAEAALRIVADCGDAARAKWLRFAELRASGPVWQVLHEADRLGSGAQALLLAAAATERERALAGLERAAERLGIRILVPLGVCVLPSFVLLGVVPVLIAVMGGTPSSLIAA